MTKKKKCLLVAGATDIFQISHHPVQYGFNKSIDKVVRISCLIWISQCLIAQLCLILYKVYASYFAQLANNHNIRLSFIHFRTPQGITIASLFRRKHHRYRLHMKRDTSKAIVKLRSEQYDTQACLFHPNLFVVSGLGLDLEHRIRCLDWLLRARFAMQC